MCIRDRSVEATLGAGSLSEQEQRVVAIAVIFVGSVAVLAILMRVRSENRTINDSLLIELDD